MAGSIEKRGKNSYRLVVSGGLDGNGRQVKKTKTVTCSDMKAAEKELARFITDIEDGKHATSGKMTLAAFYEYWKKNHATKNHQATTIAYNDFIFARIKATLGHKRLDKIEPKHLLSFYENLAEPGIKKLPKRKKKGQQGDLPPAAGSIPEAGSVPTDATPAATPEAETGASTTDATPPEIAAAGSATQAGHVPAVGACLSANTIRKHHALISSLLNKAVQWGLIPNNAADRVEPPKVDQKPKAIYDQETLGAFLQAIDGEGDKQKLWILLALTGGLRREEIFGLEWRHVDFANSSLRVEQASVYVPGTGTIPKGTKNRSSDRLVSIPGSVMEILSRHRLTQNKKRLKMGGHKDDGGKWAGAKEPGGDRVFTQWDGRPAHPHSFNTWLRRLVKEHQLPPISPHAFRHMAATYLIAGGTDVRTVSGKLGHSRTSTTMNIYSHLLKSAEQETAERMETFLTQTSTLAKSKKGQAN